MANGVVRDNAQAAGRHWAIPIPGKTTAPSLLRPAAALASGGDYVATYGIEVLKSRVVYLEITITNAAAGNIVSIIPEVSSKQDPLLTEWYPIGITDGVISEEDLDTSLTAVANGYAGNNFGSLTFRPMEIRTAASDGTEVTKLVVPVDVSGWYWVRFRVAEVGVTGTPATLELSYSKSA